MLSGTCWAPWALPASAQLSHPGRRALLLAPSCDEDADHRMAKHCPPSHTGSGTHPLALESEFSPPCPTVPLWTQREICTGLNRPDATLPLRRHKAGYIPASAGHVCVRHPPAVWQCGLWVPLRHHALHQTLRADRWEGGHRSGLGGSALTRTVIQSQGVCGHGGSQR